jgi:hypothetical protein
MYLYQYFDFFFQLDNTLTEQEIMTLARHFSSGPQSPELDFVKMRAIAQEQLRKRNFESFSVLAECMMQQDKKK